MANTTKSTSKNSSRGKASTTKKRGRPPKRQPKNPSVNRQVWALLYGLLGIISLLSLMRFDGFVLEGIFNVFSALFGIGVYLVPFSFFGAAIIMIIRPKGPVRLRTTSVLMLPFILGSLFHLIYVDNLTLSIKAVFGLFATGVSHSTGGFLSGLISMLFAAAISKTGSLIVFIFLLISTLLITFNLTPAAIWSVIKAPEYEYEDEEEEAKYTTQPNPIIKKAIEKKATRASKKQFDIPLDPPLTKNDISINDDPFNEPEQPKKPITPAEYLENINKPQKNKKEEYKPCDIDGLVRLAAENAPQKEEKEPTKLSPEDAQKLSDDIDKSQKAPVSQYAYPPINLLDRGTNVSSGDTTSELTDSSKRLIDTLQSFNIDAQIINIVRGPSVTRFEITISRGIKFSRITSLSDDIALSLGAASVRIAPIPDKLAIGIEVPNKIIQTVYIRDVVSSKAFSKAKSKISFAVGKDITGSAIIGDIAKMPHMLIAGTTGSGKSVCINTLLISLLYKSTPEEVRLIMIDPKMIELAAYNGIPHLLIPVVTDPHKAAGALNWAVGEMMKRYKLFSEHGAKDLPSYNAIMRQKKNSEEEGEWNTLPQVVIVIDELADLMMVAAKDVEEAICRIAQMARAAGMHLVIATQRPSADVITGIMKANIPSRIAFAVASQIESRIILDQTGAEKLIGKGDMLFNPLGASKPTRVQGCFLSTPEVEKVIEFVKKSGEADYSEEVIEHIEKVASGKSAGSNGINTSNAAADEDELLPQAIQLVVDSGQASVSMLQRRLKLGYARAARLVDQMEDRGIVGPFEGSKPREVRISKDDWQEMKLRQMD